jgi:hypothetical protein
MSRKHIGEAIFLVGILGLAACGDSQPPIDQQERWACNAAVLSSHIRTCHPCNNDDDCSGFLLRPFTACGQGRSLVPTAFGGCFAPVTVGTVTAGECKMEDVRLDPPAQVAAEKWTATTCLPMGSTAQQADECCKKRCECIFNACDHPGFVPPGDQVVCNTHEEDNSIAAATPIPDKQNSSVAQRCNGEEAGLQFSCSPFKTLPEGQAKAQISASLDGSSTVRITVDGNKGPLLTPTGTIRYLVESCGAAQCGFHVTEFAFSVPNFSIKGNDITNVVVHDGREWTDGTVTMSTGDFIFPSNAMRIATNFVAAGKSGSLTVHNLIKLPGNVDLTSQVLTLKGLVSQEQDDTTVDIDLDLRAIPFNRPPVAHAEPRNTIECNTTLGASVTLDATQSTDPDGNIFTELWSLLNIGFIGFGPKVPFILPYGPHTLQLQVNDKAFAEDFDNDPVNVVDTTSPDLVASVDPSCLWAPDHRMVLFQFGSGLSATSSDVCDPAPTVEVANVTSNQPSESGGQGNTVPDVLMGKKAFCVRAERQGTNPFPRTYTVTVQAKDFAGNITNKAVTIVVNHDQSDSKCPHVPATRVVDDADPRCIAN